jgi:hypothetical protein
MLLETIVALAIINATIPGQDIPIEVQTRLIGDESGQAQPAASSIAEAPPGLDIAAITGLVGLGIAWFQGNRQNRERANANADTQQNVAKSLKATDTGIAEIANNVATALSQLATVPQNAEVLKHCKEVAQQNAKAWNEDLKQYYGNKPPTTDKDIGLDKVRTKLKEVNKTTQPTPDTEAVAS